MKKILKVSGVVVLMASALVASCVGLQKQIGIERTIATSNYGSELSLAEIDQHNLSSKNFYLNKIQPIFNNRCVTCHSCFNSPCQLNLTSFDGVERGAHKDDVDLLGLNRSSFCDMIWAKKGPNHGPKEIYT